MARRRRKRWDSERRNPADEARRRAQRAAREGGPVERRLADHQARRVGAGRVWGGLLRVAPGDPALRTARDLADRLGGPFRAPHYSCSCVGLLQEADLAAGGVLYLEEVQEFLPRCLRDLGERLRSMRNAPYVFAVWWTYGTDLEFFYQRMPRLPQWVQDLDRYGWLGGSLREPPPGPGGPGPGGIPAPWVWRWEPNAPNPPKGDLRLRQLERHLRRYPSDESVFGQLVAELVRRQGLTRVERYFLERHRGYGYPRGAGPVEQAQALIDTARDLAAAEEWYVSQGYSFAWHGDSQLSHEEGREVFCAYFLTPDEEVLLSRSGYDPEDLFDRSAQAEIALEAMELEEAS